MNQYERNISAVAFRRRKIGFRDGPAIFDEEGKLLTARDINDMLLEI